MLGVKERDQLSHLGEEGAVDWEPLREKAELGCEPSLLLSYPGPAGKATAGIAPSQPYIPVLCMSLNYQYLRDLHFVGLRFSIYNREFSDFSTSQSLQRAGGKCFPTHPQSLY